MMYLSGMILIVRVPDVLSLTCLYVCITGDGISEWHDPHCEGNRRVITHLFEWKWSDIEKECVSFLGPHGFCGVQVRL